MTVVLEELTKSLPEKTVVLEALTKRLPRKDSSYRSADQKSTQNSQ